MSLKKHFTKVGEDYELSAAATFLMVATYAYENFREDVIDKPGRLRQIVDQALAQATAGGFARADVFSTLLSKHETSVRMLELAQEVSNFMGGDDVLIAFIRDAAGVKNGGAL